MAIEEWIDEIIAIMVVGGYLASWFIMNPMPTEPLMLILGYYFGAKLTKVGD